MPCALHPAVVDGLNPCSRCGKQFCPDCLIELKGNRICASCKAEAVKDLQSGVGDSDLRLAKRIDRFAAFLLDWLIQIVLNIPLIIISMMSQFQFQPQGGTDGRMKSAIVQLLINGVQMVIMVGYEALFLQFKGATPGKMALRLRVVNADGSKITPGQAWLRPVIRLVTASCCAIDYIVSWFRTDKCCIHDLATRTRVVKI